MHQNWFTIWQERSCASFCLSGVVRTKVGTTCCFFQTIQASFCLLRDASILHHCQSLAQWDACGLLPWTFFPHRSLTSLVNELELMDRNFSEWLIPTLNAISRCISLNQDTSPSPFTNIRKLYGAIHQGVSQGSICCWGSGRGRETQFSL